jgi:hypothetical protein
VTRRPWIATAASVAIVLFAAVSYRDFAARWACPGDPQFASMLVPLNLGSALQQGQLLPYVQALLALLRDGNIWYLTEFLPKPHYTSSMLPGFDHPVLARATFLAFLIFIAEGLVLYLWTVLARRRREEWWPVIAVGAVWLFYFANVVSRLRKNDYEAELMEPVMAMAALGSFWLAWPRLVQTIGEARMLVAARAGLVALLTFSIASQAALLDNYFPYAMNAWLAPGDTPGQRYSISAFGYGRLEPSMLAAARLCGIAPADHPRHLVIDELTSFAFRASIEPYFLTFFEPDGWGLFRPDPTALWREKRSAGMIVSCERVPAVFADKVTRSNGFCCLPSFAPS